MGSAGQEHGWGRAGLALLGGWLALVAIVAIARPWDPVQPPPQEAGRAGAEVWSLSGHRAADRLVAERDGAYFALIANDLRLHLLSRTLDDPGDAAYRAARIGLPAVVATAALGDPSRINLGLLAAQAIASGALVGAIATLLARRGRDMRWALGAALLPGALISMRWGGCDLPAAAFGAWAIVAWTSAQPRRGVAALLLVGAVLTRESLLLVVAALAIDAVVNRRWRELVPLLPAPAALAAWLAFVHHQVGAWPWQHADGNLSAPFVGLAQSWSASREPGIGVLVVLGTLIAAVAIVSSERSWLTWTAIMYVGLLIICGHIVWTWWGYFSRPLLPFHALAIAALAPRTRSSSQP